MSMVVNIYIKLCLCLVVLVTVLGACKQRSPEEVENIIAKSETLRHIDEICKEFPKPERFELENKDLYGNSGMSAVNYKYIAHMPFEEVKAFYQDSKLREVYNFRDEHYAEPLINEIWFRRDEVSINIENRPPSWIVNIGCSVNHK